MLEQRFIRESRQRLGQQGRVPSHLLRLDLLAPAFEIRSPEPLGENRSRRARSPTKRRVQSTDHEKNGLRRRLGARGSSNRSRLYVEPAIHLGVDQTVEQQAVASRCL